MFSGNEKDKCYRKSVKKFEIRTVQSKVFFEDLSLKNRLSSFTFYRQSNKDSKLPRFFVNSISVGLPPIENPILGGKFKQGATKKTKSLSVLSELSQFGIPRKSSKTRVCNRCIETGRSHSVLRFCKLSRIILRENASKGRAPGVKKASW